MSETFSDVDKSARVLEAIAWQERIDAWPQIRAYKERSYELCSEAEPRLDVGSGPDQDTLRIEVPGVSTELIDRVRRCRRDIGYRNGTVSQQMPALMGGLGLAAVTVEGFPLELTDPDDAFGLPGWPRYWSGHFDATEVAEWERGVAASREGGFRFACSYVVTAAVRR